MFSWHAIPFARFLIPFASGIIVYNQFPNTFAFAGFALLLSLIFICIHRIRPVKKRNSSQRVFYGVLVFISLFFIAIVWSNLKDNKNDSQHYSKIQNPKSLIFTISDAVIEKPNYYQSYANILEVKNHSGKYFPVIGTVLLRVSKKHVQIRPCIGEHFEVDANLSIPEAVKNPEDFDYKTFLKRKHIWHILNIQNGKIRKLAFKQYSIRSYAESMRKACLSILTKNISDSVSAGIAEALLLGYKDDIDQNVSQIFTRSGTIHILAVSGMHAGLIYLILNFLTGFLRKTEKGKWIQTLIILAALWLYACITGLSSSVIRASVMFTIISSANLFNRKSNVFNTIYASAFLMLLFDSNYLFDAGFQLSYAAVLGIVFLFPKLKETYSSKGKIATYILDMSNVTISAQIFTFPLSLYYFSQFPLYFLINNLIVMPLFTIVLIGLVILLSLSFFTPFVSFLGCSLHYLIQWAITFMQWTDSWPNAVLKPIFLGLYDAVVVYVILFLLLAWIIHKNKWLWFSLLGLILVFTIYQSGKTYNQERQKLIVVHDIHGHDVYTCIQGRKAFVISDSIFFYRNGIQLYLNKFLAEKGINQIEAIDQDQFFVSTNICSSRALGFQFFDRFMTKKFSVHLSIQGEVFYHVKGNESELHYLIQNNYNNLIFTNLLSNKQRKYFEEKYFKQFGDSVKFHTLFFTIDLK